VGVAAGEQGDFVAEGDEFLRQPMNDALGTAIQLRRNCFGQWRNLSNMHSRDLLRAVSRASNLFLNKQVLSIAARNLFLPEPGTFSGVPVDRGARELQQRDSAPAFFYREEIRARCKPRGRSIPRCQPDKIPLEMRYGELAPFKLIRQRGRDLI
jgi:hypothetical protein